MQSVVLFGASALGADAYLVMKSHYNIVAFCDNDKSKWGKEYMGIPIISLEQVLEFEDTVIIITSVYTLQIAEQLLNHNVREFGVYNGKEIVEEQLPKIKYYNSESFNTINRQNNIGFITTSNSGSNVYAMMKLIPDEYKEKYNISLYHSKDMGYDNFKGYSFFDEILHNKLLIFDVVSPDQKLKDNIFIELWHGFPIKGLGYMDKNQNNGEKLHQHWSNFDKITSYSSFYNVVMSGCMGIPRDKFSITGMPRNDLLFSSKGREQLEKLLKVDLRGNRIVYLMPTFRNSKWLNESSGNKNWDNIFGFSTFNQKEFEQFLEENRIEIVLKTHPLEEEEVMGYLNNNQIKNVHLLTDQLLYDNKIDLYDTLSAADLLITDYSSVYFDYLLIDRPVLFTPIDINEYAESRGFLLEPYASWAPGPMAIEQKTLQYELLRLLNDSEYYKSERQKLKEIIHQYKDDKSTERIWELIDELMMK